MSVVGWVVLVGALALPLVLIYRLIRARNRLSGPGGGQPFEGPVCFPGSHW